MNLISDGNDHNGHFASAAMTAPSAPAGPAWRRTVELVAPDDGTVVAGIEDEIHHVEMRVRHDGIAVVDVEARGLRLPWTGCADARHELERLVGVPIGASVGEITRAGRPREQCTHMFDVAAAAIRFAATGQRRRRYECVVPDNPRSPLTGWIGADDGWALQWSVEGRRIVDPEPYAGQSLLAGFTEWCEATLAGDEVDAALLLRRAVWMAASRMVRLDDWERLSDSGVRPGACFSSQPQRIHLARRNRGTQRDYGEAPPAWLAGMTERWNLDEPKGSS